MQEQLTNYGHRHSRVGAALGPDDVGDTAKLVARLLSRTVFLGNVRDAGSACWHYLTVTADEEAGDDYASIRLADGRSVYVHRIALAVFAGRTIPAGATIDHLCGLKRCINPQHLAVAWPDEHQRRHAVIRWQRVKGGAAGGTTTAT